jgi:adenine-specific DNA-methyltransferase
MKPYYEQDGITIYHGDCREILPTLGPVDLVLTDPPYNGVLADDWDNQWGSDADFLAWLGGVFDSLAGLLADNGTTYVFSGTRLAARVEVLMSSRFRVIASAVWDKGSGRKGAG